VQSHGITLSFHREMADATAELLTEVLERLSKFQPPPGQ
jgi:hypothetical protein